MGSTALEHIWAVFNFSKLGASKLVQALERRANVDLNSPGG